MMTSIEPADLATHFCWNLNVILDSEQLTEIIRRNALPQYTESCATHDFCDPNQAMADALRSLGTEFHPDRCDAINAAWDIARKRQFQIV